MTRPPRVRDILDRKNHNTHERREIPLFELVDGHPSALIANQGVNQALQEQVALEKRVKPPPSRGASHTRTKELKSYITEILSSPSLTKEDAARRFSAILARTQANSLCARRFRSFLNELQDDGLDNKKKGSNILSAQEAIYYKSSGGLIRGSDCRQAVIAINNLSQATQQLSTPSTSFTRKQLCAMVMRMSQNDINNAAAEVAQIAPTAFLAELKDDQIQVAAPLIIKGLSQNIRPQDHDLRARALLHLWSKDSVYRGLWNWYHIDATQSNDRL